MSTQFEVGGVRIGGAAASFFLIAGPCVIESASHCYFLAEALAGICRPLQVPLIFKASFDKANRTSVKAFRGPGIEDGLAVLKDIRARLGMPVLTDVHEPWQVEKAAEVVDCLQIPAFLCRQTDLLIAAARSGRTVNLKKGQFLAPWDLQPAIQKITDSGCRKLLLTERGTCFGYNNLVVDVRSLGILRNTGFPVVLDVTHSLQLPGGKGDSSGGQPEFIEILARAGVAVGVDGLFMEVHDRPDQALSDGPNSLPLGSLETLLKKLIRLRAALGEQS
ncbi:MAG: 3-deoxy-8-phosphooctulonate synthase [Acidobacteriota bacterium]